MGFLPNTRAVGCQTTMMYFVAKANVAHCQQNGSVHYLQEPMRVGTNVAHRNAMSAESIASNDVVL